MSRPSESHRRPQSFFGVAAPPMFLTTAFLILVVGLSIDLWTQVDGSVERSTYEIRFGLTGFTIEPDNGNERSFQYADLLDDCSLRLGNITYAGTCAELQDIHDSGILVLVSSTISVICTFIALNLLFLSLYSHDLSYMKEIATCIAGCASAFAWILWLIIAVPACEDFASMLLQDSKVRYILSASASCSP
eukprot:TRINITY_DN4214_c0_g1_i1.p1 TRINITY_DN4214_c0_g1~~TRINITY_DN4214_c0_g1_i1.p1  ORF type:complete len:191 (+),score=33.42 TRINITY_DN4214_c0_g1_i1:48-620(+)